MEAVDNNLLKLVLLAKSIFTKQSKNEKLLEALSLEEYTNFGNLLTPIVYNNLCKKFNDDTTIKHYLKTGGATLYFLSDDTWTHATDRLRDTIMLSSEEDLNDTEMIPLNTVQEVESALQTTDDMISTSLRYNPWYVYFCIIVLFSEIW